MIQYILLCKDEANSISYYYNMDDGYIYLDDVKEKEKAAKTGARFGGMLSFLIYPFVGLIGTWMPSIVMGILSMILGIIAAIIISPILINKSEMFFVEANRQETTKDKVLLLYKQGKRFRKKYLKIEISMFLFAVVLSIFVCVGNYSALLFWCIVAIWAVWGILFLGKRPLCNKRFKKNIVDKEK